MSIEAMVWAFNQPIKPATLKFVLVALADNCNVEGNAWPSLKYLSAKTCLNRKTIIQGLDELEEMGIIVDTGQRKGRTGQIKVYSFVGHINEEFGTVPDTEPLEDDERVPSVPPKSPVCTTKESHRRYSEPLKNPKEPSIAKINEKNKEAIFTTEQVKVALRGDPAYRPLKTTSMILPGGWEEEASAVKIPHDRIYESWRKFVEISSYPFLLDRWKKWIARDFSAQMTDDE